MGITYEELSNIIHSDGAWLVLLAYAFRSVFDAVLAGIWEALKIDDRLKTIREATRDGVTAALECSCCKGGGKGVELLAKAPIAKQTDAGGAESKRRRGGGAD